MTRVDVFVQMTVATKIEAPVKFLFPSSVDPAKQYPFSVLGLGDIVIPATFCSLMRCADRRAGRAAVSLSGSFVVEAILFFSSSCPPPFSSVGVSRGFLSRVVSRGVCWYY